jgi:hypothetical protein
MTLPKPRSRKLEKLIRFCKDKLYKEFLTEVPNPLFSSYPSLSRHGVCRNSDAPKELERDNQQFLFANYVQTAVPA